MKFGGTSVGSASAIKQSVQIVSKFSKEYQNLVVVTSAISGVTDILLNAAIQAADGNSAQIENAATNLRSRHMQILAELITIDQLRNSISTELLSLINQFADLCHAIFVLGEATPRALDAVASLGERCSVLILAGALSETGVKALAIDASSIIRTDANYQAANPDMNITKAIVKEKLLPILKSKTIPVVTGFIGGTASGSITTLGRGGSDFTAAILGVVLPADEVWIWTDVDGVMTTDPRICPDAQTIRSLSFKEISELAYFGAKVLHPKTIRPVIEAGITLKVLNTFNPDHPGTEIYSETNQLNENIIKAVTIIKDLKLITIEGRGMLGVPGVAARTFSAIASTHTSVPLISQASSEQSICFAVPADTAPRVLNALHTEFEREFVRRDIDSVWASEQVVIVSVVGAGMRNIPGVAGKVFTALGDEHVNVIAIAQGSSEVSISFIVSTEDGSRAVQALHRLIH